MCGVYGPSAVIGHVLYSYKCAVPATCQYLHMTNVCRIYQSWERGIINIDFLPLLFVITCDSHSILRCWMMFIKAQFSKHCVSVCLFTSIMYHRMPTIHIPAVCRQLCVLPALSVSQPFCLIGYGLQCERRARVLCQRSGSQSPAFSLRRPAFGAKPVHVGFVADKVALGQVSLSVFFIPPPVLFCQCFISIHS
jgi:hypothetical protein